MRGRPRCICGSLGGHRWVRLAPGACRSTCAAVEAKAPEAKTEAKAPAAKPEAKAEAKPAKATPKKGGKKAEAPKTAADTK